MDGNSKMAGKEASQPAKNPLDLEDLKEVSQDTSKEETAADGIQLQKDASGQLVTFNVKYKDNMQKISLPDQATIAELQMSISEIFEICKTKFILHGCGLNANASKDLKDTQKLSSLKLTAFNYIHVEESDTSQISIDIVEEPIGRKINLKMSSATTFGELKERVYHITKIPVHHQQWSGAPKDDQEMCSALAEIDQVLKVCSSESSLASCSVSSSAGESGSTSESSVLKHVNTPMDGSSMMAKKEVSQPAKGPLSLDDLEEVFEAKFIGGANIDEMQLEKVASRTFLTFNVKYKDNMQKIGLPFRATIAKLHMSISELFAIHPKNLILHGCGLHTNGSNYKNDTHKVGRLKLSAFNYIRVEELGTPQISIDVLVEPKWRKINLKMSWATTFGELKEHVYYITNIPVCHQLWWGAPKDDKVKCSALAENNQVLRVGNSEMSLDSLMTSSSEDGLYSTSESSDEESSIDDELTEPFDTIGGIMLISEGNKTPLEGSKQFVQNYKMTYGAPSLEFFVGKLDSAYHLVCCQPADENKLLAIYMHHCESSLSNIFCQNVLKNNDILAIFKNLFIVYGWDMTRTSNACFFLNELHDVISGAAARVVRKLELEKYPALLIVGKKKSGQVPSIAVIHGTHDVLALQSTLHREYKLLSGLSK